MAETTPDLISPAVVRRLARLVTVLTVVMILGIVTVVAMLAVKLNSGSEIALPDTIALPEATAVRAVTTTADELIVLTDDAVMIFDRTSGKLKRTISLGD